MTFHNKIPKRAITIDQDQMSVMAMLTPLVWKLAVAFISVISLLVLPIILPLMVHWTSADAVADMIRLKNKTKEGVRTELIFSMPWVVLDLYYKYIDMIISSNERLHIF